MQPKGNKEWKFADNTDVNNDIRDFQSFMKEFAKYLLGRMSQDQAEDVMMLISCFADYNVERDPRFSLAKLGNIFQLRSDDVVRLPSPFDGWLEKFSDLIEFLIFYSIVSILLNSAFWLCFEKLNSYVARSR